MPGALLTQDFFAPLVGGLFHVDLGDAVVDLRLEDLTALPSVWSGQDAGAAIPDAGLPARREPFSLLFRGPLDRLLPQQTYRMTHESVAEPLDIFIVPIAREHDGYVYQAIFA